jgi:cystathionine beta-lyase/cystathionine gamma-synthase
VAEIAHAAGAQLAVDSTMATPVATKPLALGADLVVHSLTKYLNGHGDALGGAVIGRKDALSKLRQGALIHFGGALSPFNAWLIRRGLHTLELRMKVHEDNARRVASYLESHPAIKRVIYPGLPSHPQYPLAQRQMSNASGMLTFQTREDGAEVARRFYRKLQVLTYAVSLGKQRSLLFYISTKDILESSFSLQGAALKSYKDFAGDGIFRVSIGLEAPEDLCADLDQALKSNDSNLL